MHWLLCITSFFALPSCNSYQSSKKNKNPVNLNLVGSYQASLSDKTLLLLVEHFPSEQGDKFVFAGFLQENKQAFFKDLDQGIMLKNDSPEKIKNLCAEYKKLECKDYTTESKSSCQNITQEIFSSPAVFFYTGQGLLFNAHKDKDGVQSLSDAGDQFIMLPGLFGEAEYRLKAWNTDELGSIKSLVFSETGFYQLFRRNNSKTQKAS